MLELKVFLKEYIVIEIHVQIQAGSLGIYLV